MDPPDPFAPSGEEFDPFAPNTPPWYIDVLHTAPAHFGKGVVGAATGIPTLTDLGLLGVEKGANALGYPGIAAAAKTGQEYIAPATYGGVMGTIEGGSPKIGGAVEKVWPAAGQAIKGGTGKWPEAETPPGKVVGNTLEIVPSLFTGVSGLPKLATKGAGVVERMVRALAGGIGGTGAEYLSEAVLPEAFKPVAKGIGSAVGVLAGPTAARKMVTPFAATPEHAKDVKTLTDAGMKGLSAGEVSGSPKLKQIESNIRGPSQEARNTRKFTEQVIAPKAGMPEGTTNLYEGFAPAEAKFNTDLRDAVRAAEIKGTSFQSLQKDLADIRKAAYKDLRDEGIGKIDDLLAQIKGSPGALSIPGGRYNQLRQEVQKTFGDKSLTGTQRDYLGQIRQRLDKAMGDNIPNLAEMQSGHANLSLLRGGAKHINEKGQVTPEDLKNIIMENKGWGSNAYTGKRGMSPLAQAGESVLKLPPKTEAGPITTAASTMIGALLERMAKGVTGGGGDPGFTGGILGHMLAQQAAAGQRALGRPLYAGAEPYLRNQIWKPSAATALDPAMAVKLLRSPYPGQSMMAARE